MQKKIKKKVTILFTFLVLSAIFVTNDICCHIDIFDKIHKKERENYEKETSS